MIKGGNTKERERHHEPKFIMILNPAGDFIKRTKDQELFRLFIETVKLDAGSADEGPSWTMGYIFMHEPDWTIEQLKAAGLTKNVISRLEFGLENVASESPEYERLKKRIRELE